MSRNANTPAAESARKVYSEPEELDRLLEQMRRIRGEAEAAHRHPADAAVAPPDGAEPVLPPEPPPPVMAPMPAPRAPATMASEPAAEPARIEPATGEPSKVEPPKVEPRRLRQPSIAAARAESAPAEGAKAPAATPQATTASAPDGAPAALAGAALRHLQASVIERLKAFVAGSDAAAKPAPLPAAPAPAAAGPRAAGPAGRESDIKTAILASKQAFIATGLFSLVINVLMLTGPLFMLQVYDRVMSSGSIPTLIALSALTAALYGVIGLLELVRSRVIVRIGIDLDRRLADRVFEASLKRTLQAPGSSLLALRELDNLRQFIAGPGPLTFFDAPWTPIYLLVVFLLHWTLGIAATIGAVLLVAIAWASEVRSKQPLQEAGKAAARGIELAETGQRNAEAITAMGMLSAYRARWQAANRDALAWQIFASDRLSSMSSLSKTLRLLLQSMMLAIGAALAIKSEISAGTIVAGTIIFGRALAPVEQAIGHWRSFSKARESFGKLSELLTAHPRPAERMTLPRPKGHLEVTALRVAAPSSRTVILSGITFNLEPGRMVAVIGPSASGKSTLARALVGLWEPFGGHIRLDGARLDQWNAEELGGHIGYLPQDVELFAGTVRENISRFRPEASDADVIAAAKAAHAHDLIMALPQSYETELGAFGTYLSAGQRQRIGLARALFGTPALVVLDEPNANLDRSGDEALSSAIDGMRARGQAVVLVSHRVQVIGKADYLLYIERGAQRAFGPRAEVIRYLQTSGLGQSGGGERAPQGQPAAAARSAAPAGAAVAPAAKT